MLEIRLREPRNHFLYQLGQTAFFAWPRHVYARRGRDWYKDVPSIGSGPFVVTRHVARSDARLPGGLTLESASTWYGDRGNVGEVTVELEPSPAAGGKRWKEGEYDLIYESFAAAAGIDTADETVVQRAPGGDTWFLDLDASRPPFDDPRLRRALAHAIDRGRPAQALGGAPAATGGVLSPGMPGHSPRVALPFDPDRARALLSDAGHPEGRGLDEIRFPYLSIWERAVSEIAVQLEAVGFRVRRLPRHSRAALDAALESSHASLGIGYYTFPDPVGGFLQPLFSGQAHYRDERLAVLLARAGTLRDEDERLRICREFERIWIGEHAAVVPLVYRDALLWRRPWVTGLWANAITRSTFAQAVVRLRATAPPRVGSARPRGR